jgi:hypothetical protein
MLQFALNFKNGFASGTEQVLLRIYTHFVAKTTGCFTSVLFCILSLGPSIDTFLIGVNWQSICTNMKDQQELVEFVAWAKHFLGVTKVNCCSPASGTDHCNVRFAAKKNQELLITLT